MFLYAGLVIIGAGIFDMVDGRVARQTEQVTVFGAFFDSVIDRYSDVVLFFGLLVFYARGNRFFYVVLAAFVMVTSLMVSYTRARAEALIGTCKVGFMERPERVVLIIIGALFNRWGAMAPVLWVLAVLSTITVIHRIRYTYQKTKGLAPVRETKPLLASSPSPPKPSCNPPRPLRKPNRNFARSPYLGLPPGFNRFSPADPLICSHQHHVPPPAPSRR